MFPRDQVTKSASGWVGGWSWPPSFPDWLIPPPCSFSDCPSCAFPFTYKGVLYFSCIPVRENSNKHWCGLTRNYDKDKKWKFCVPEDQPKCIFPFIYKGESYFHCTSSGHRTQGLWCATTSDYDGDRQWKTCTIYGGNSEKSGCVFPFLYRGQRMESCIGESNSRYWCSTTRNYDQDKRWQFCPDTSDLLPVPHFPFLYKDKVYYSCTIRDSLTRSPWCALTHDYDNDGKWEYCSF
uniref:Fibronectin type-II domain-containing protein n=1 Tax=Ornithorhynchus anatinus TaxID=9258 RepID=K7EC34_ORNAN